GETLEVLADDFGQQKGRNRGKEKCNENQREWMRECIAVSTFATRKCAEEFRDPVAEINWQTENGAELDHDGVHLPEAVGKIDAEEGFANPQMGGRADRQKFGKTLDNAQQH